MRITYSRDRRKELLKEDLIRAKRYLYELLKATKNRPPVFLENEYFKDLYGVYNKIDEAIDDLSDLIIKIENENWEIVEEML